MLLIEIRERGNVPRKLQKAFTAASKAAWHETGKEFHANYRDRRFTEQHARDAGYTKRKGELQPRGSASFRKSYTGRKLRIHKHTRPLEFTGETRKAVQHARLAAVSKGVRVTYSGASKFNFRHPKSRVRMSEEFRKILPQEARELGAHYDRELDKRLALEDS